MTETIFKHAQQVLGKKKLTKTDFEAVIYVGALLDVILWTSPQHEDRSKLTFATIGSV